MIAKPWGSARDHARALRYQAGRSEAAAAEKRAHPRNAWSHSDAEDLEHSAKRMRAMALLCDMAPADTPSGRIDYRGLDRSDLGYRREGEIIAQVEAEEAQHRTRQRR